MLLAVDPLSLLPLWSCYQICVNLPTRMLGEPLCKHSKQHPHSSMSREEGSRFQLNGYTDQAVNRDVGVLWAF